VLLKFFQMCVFMFVYIYVCCIYMHKGGMGLALYHMSQRDSAPLIIYVHIQKYRHTYMC